mmetsp:Transcript_4859/g.14618  ORF Transcript_4859/g.14618 Transcript_4859/m.14618 type:complete len:606 (-) Transcript_4859:236-2053(-)
MALAVGLAVVATCAAKAVPASHPAHRAPRSLMNRIATSKHAQASPFHPDHYSSAATVTSSFAPRSSPLNFGADPTGMKDSTAALQKAIAVCLNQSQLSPNGNFPGDTSFDNGHSVRDMGGCQVDLAGGEYLISQSLIIPEYNANMIFGGGSLVAAKDFDGDFMIVIGVQGSCRVPQGSCNIDINFPNLFLDGSHVASAMQINNVMGVTIGPGGYFLNFSAYGIQINAGHEVMIDRCWLGETNFDFNHVLWGVPPNATAIQINGNDHYVLNTIVFSSRIGLEINGAADYIQGVHVWFPWNHALAFAQPPVAAKAFFVTKGGNRFEGCYADGGRCVFTGAGLGKNRWMNGFECCAGGGLSGINHGIILVSAAGDTIGPGLEITHNMFGGGSVWHETNSSDPDVLTVAARSSSKAASPGLSCTFKYNTSGLQCSGLTHYANAASPDACKAKCCAQQGQGSCNLWQFSEGGGGCWYDESGSGTDCGPVRNAGPWVGGATVNPAASSGKIVGTRISDNSFNKNSGVGTRAVGIAAGPGSNFTINFCDNLVFKSIALVRTLTVTDSAAVGLTAHALLPQGCTLTVLTSQPLSSAGTVFVEVDSSTYEGTFV